MSENTLIGAIDQGTSSSRFLIFSSHNAELLTYHQKEIHQLYPQQGWVEQDPKEILSTVIECIDKAVHNLKELKFDSKDIKAIGITNQRETTVLWDKITGEPLYNAIVWLDTRSTETVNKLLKQTPGNDKDYLRPRCGLPITSYFSALKIRWLIDNVQAVREAIDNDRCLFGNIDSWILWNLTGSGENRKHYTDVTNASRTMLMNIHSLTWDSELCRFFNIPLSILPEIHSSSEIYGTLENTILAGTRISGILGDQQAALVGQFCFKPGQIKNTYGTGCFLLGNTGPDVVSSSHGLLTTVAYKFGKDNPACYALEGSVAIAGAAVQWLRDQLGIIKTAPEIEQLASKVEDTHGCYFVPAFSGLFCPYWEQNARGLIIGLSQYTNKNHIARACLEAVCFQTKEVIEAMAQDSKLPIKSLQVDGGMTDNSLLMQLQSDIAGVPIVRPSMHETTSLGAAIAAGLADGVNIWTSDILSSNSNITVDTFSPGIDEKVRNSRFVRWKEAVKRSMNWENSDNA